MDQSCHKFRTWFGEDLGFFLFTKLDINDMRQILRGSDSKSVGIPSDFEHYKKRRLSSTSSPKIRFHVFISSTKVFVLLLDPFEKNSILSQDMHVLFILQNVQAGIPWSLAQKTQHMQYGRCIWKHMR